MSRAQDFDLRIEFAVETDESWIEELAKDIENMRISFIPGGQAYAGKSPVKMQGKNEGKMAYKRDFKA